MDHLLTEARNLDSAALDRMSALEIVRLMNREDAKVIPAVAAVEAAVAIAIDVIAERFRGGGRLIYAGAGTSGRLGVLDASECPPTFNSPSGQVVGVIAGGYAALTTAVEGAEDRPELARNDLEAVGLTSKDVLVGIATSGRTPYVIAALEYARHIGAYAIGFTCVPDSELGPAADLVIAPFVGPEVLTGSTRLKSGTATKLVLNMLTTGAMVRTGKTYGNLMVDLRATNTKLKARTNRIVRHFTGISVAEADSLLARCDSELKTAIVAQLGGLSPQQARERLAAAGGQIRAALDGQVTPTSVVPDQSLIIGIDGGGSRTTALLAALQSDGTFPLIAEGTAGPSNLRTVGVAAAQQALDAAVDAAFASAGHQRGPVRSACLGLAGAGRSDERQLVTDWARRRQIAQDVAVVSDVELLLEMLPEKWGVALIAGTGSAAWGQSPDGVMIRRGGWGPLLGDEGSAYWIVVEALRAVARQHDGRGEPKRLSGLLMAGLGINAGHELIDALYGGKWDRKRLAELAPIVFEAAADGDAVASEIIRRGATELASQAAAVARAVAHSEGSLPIAMSGGLLLHQPIYRQLVLNELARTGWPTITVTLIHEPAAGALRLAAGSVTSIV